jgi:protein-disulfide isomerase
VLGTEPQVIETYVQNGTATIVFWPVLNHGNPSVYSTVSAHCAGDQDPAKFWEMHGLLFENQGELWSATRDYFVNFAVSIGLDQAAFEACYDAPETLAEVMSLDSIRRERGVYAQPVFDVNGLVFAGNLPFDQFSAALESVLAEQGTS